MEVALKSNKPKDRIETLEQEIEKDFDSWRPVPEGEIAALLADLSTATVRRPVTVRLDARDLAALKSLADREGLLFLAENLAPEELA